MSLKNHKIVILIEDLYQDQEAWYPYYRLKEEGAEVYFLGPEKGKEYLSKKGYPAKAQLGIKDIRGMEFDAVIIPGGYAPDRMRRTPQMVSFVGKMHAQGKVIAAICHGAWILASADVLSGRKATCFFAIKDDIENAGAKYVDKKVVRDGNIITSRKPDDLPFFLQSIMAALLRK